VRHGKLSYRSYLDIEYTYIELLKCLSLEYANIKWKFCLLNKATRKIRPRVHKTFQNKDQDQAQVKHSYIMDYF